jgi:ubiquinone/menaquinone biosynthesis C-methylase UbiE
MTNRGQQDFIHMPSFVTRLYASLTHIESIQRQHHEIAIELTNRLDTGRLLDVGTGPGFLLTEIHKIKSLIELHGLDISSAMVELARKQLGDIPADLRVGDIRKTDYPEKYFDVITCTGSFYLWDEPEKGLSEIYRILKVGSSAFLFETYKDHDVQAVQKAIHDNLRRENILRRMISPRFLMRQLQMTYTTGEIVEIIKKTPFANNFAVEKITLGGLPAWLRIRLSR